MKRVRVQDIKPEENDKQLEKPGIGTTVTNGDSDRKAKMERVVILSEVDQNNIFKDIMLLPNKNGRARRKIGRKLEKAPHF